MNKVILIGNLGADPESRHTPNGTVVTNLSLATAETWRDKETSEKKSRTEWHRVVVFGNSAEACGKYLRKGSKVCIQGQIQTRKWQDKEGNDRYSTEIVADRFDGVHFLDAKGSNDTPSGRNSNSSNDIPF